MSRRPESQMARSLSSRCLFSYRRKRKYFSEGSTGMRLTEARIWCIDISSKKSGSGGLQILHKLQQGSLQLVAQGLLDGEEPSWKKFVEEPALRAKQLQDLRKEFKHSLGSRRRHSLLTKTSRRLQEENRLLHGVRVAVSVPLSLGQHVSDWQGLCGSSLVPKANRVILGSTSGCCLKRNETIATASR